MTIFNSLHSCLKVLEIFDISCSLVPFLLLLPTVAKIENTKYNYYFYKSKLNEKYQLK